MLSGDNMFLGQLPKRLVIGCVDSDATFGHEQWYILHYYYSKKKGGMHFRVWAIPLT
jgi:hypothetical protein